MYFLGANKCFDILKSPIINTIKTYFRFFKMLFYFKNIITLFQIKHYTKCLRNPVSVVENLFCFSLYKALRADLKLF